jgi:hypothetical protein
MQYSALDEFIGIRVEGQNHAPLLQLERMSEALSHLSADLEQCRNNLGIWATAKTRE